MTQPNQTTPTALSTGPWTIPVCDRCGYVLIPTAVSGWCHCAENREAVVLGAKHGTYSEVEVIPLSTLSRLVEELEARADDSHANGNATEDETTRVADYATEDALREAASLISQSLPKGQSDDGND